MPEGSEPDFGSESELNSDRSHRAGLVLIAGLVLELINSIVWFHGPETIAGMVAVVLIVGGVWGELFFSHRARVAGDKQLAQYDARDAEANQKAKEAALELGPVLS